MNYGTDTTPTRDIHPVIDEIVGFGAYLLSQNRPLEERYRDPDPKWGPFIGMVTSAVGSWDRQFGIIARVVDDHVVVISPVGTTYWWNVGVQVVATADEIRMYRSWADQPPDFLEVIARDMCARQPPPCQCPDEPVQPVPDDETWDGSPLGLCKRCSCSWCRLFPTHDVFGPIGGSRNVRAECEHLLTAEGFGTTWEDYLDRIPSLEELVHGIDDKPDDRMFGLGLHYAVRDEVRDHTYLEGEIARLFPGRLNEYSAAWHAVIRDAETTYKSQLEGYRAEMGKDAPWRQLVGLE